MNKLSALNKLASAYWYLTSIPGYSNDESDAALIVYDKFHYIRRSLGLLDLAPTPKCAEGFNPKGPAWL